MNNLKKEYRSILKSSRFSLFLLSICQHRRSMQIIKRAVVCSPFLSYFLLWFIDFDQEPLFFLLLLFLTPPLCIFCWLSLDLSASYGGSVAGWPFPLQLPSNWLHDWVTLTKSETKWKRGEKKRQVARRHLHNESCVVDFITYSCTESTRLPISSPCDLAPIFFFFSFVFSIW